MADSEKTKELIESLNELAEDTTVPRNVKERIKNAANALEESIDLKLRVNKALHELDEVADDPNLQAFTRTQIWNIVSVLEKIS